MNDKAYRESRDFLREKLITWKERMGLNVYRIDMEWVRDRSGGTRETVASCHYQKWQYREATISFYMPAVHDIRTNEKDWQERLEEVVVHELTHVLLGPLTASMMKDDHDYYSDIFELNTEMVSRALLWTYHEGGKRAIHETTK